MERYKNLGGDSGVSAYELGNSFIKIKFKTSSPIYIYTYAKAGQHHVDAMKRLAVSGHGLQEYINEHKAIRFDKER